MWFKVLIGRISLAIKKHRAMAAVRRNNRAAARILKQAKKEQEREGR